MGIKSDVVIMVNCVGVGHQLAEMLQNRLSENFTAEYEDVVELITDGIASSKNAALLKLDGISLTDELKGVLNDWWIDDCTSLARSDISATGRFLIWTIDHIEDDFSFGPHHLGITVGIQVPKFEYDELVLNEDIKGQSGVDLYLFSVSYDTAIEASVSVYAKTQSEAFDWINGALGEGEIPFKDSSYIGDSQVHLVSCSAD